MQNVLWLDEYKIGDEDIDRQHQYLFELANQIIRAPDTQAAIKEANLLLRYLEEHFRSEEEIMQRYHFPSYEEHVKDHQRLLKKLMEIIHDIQVGEWSAEDIIVFTRGWLLAHITDVDMLLC